MLCLFLAFLAGRSCQFRLIARGFQTFLEACIAAHDPSLDLAYPACWAVFISLARLLVIRLPLMLLQSQTAGSTPPIHDSEATSVRGLEAIGAMLSNIRQNLLQPPV